MAQRKAHGKPHGNRRRSFLKRLDRTISNLAFLVWEDLRDRMSENEDGEVEEPQEALEFTIREFYKETPLLTGDILQDSYGEFCWLREGYSVLKCENDRDDLCVIVCVKSNPSLFHLECVNVDPKAPLPFASARS